MKKYQAGTAIALSLIMGVSLLSGCSTGSSSAGSTAATSAEASSSAKKDANTIEGTIKSVSSNSITIQTESSQTQKKSDNSSTKTISLTDSTKISQEMPGNPPQGDGNGQEPPQQSSSDSDSSKSKPSGNDNSGKSSSEKNTSGNDNSENSSSKQSSSASTEKDSKNRSQEQPPEKPNEDKNSDSQDSDSKNSGDKNSESKSLSISDLKENDRVSITLDSDGKASEISLLSGGGSGGTDSSAAPTSYSSVTEYSKDSTTTGKSYSSTGTDENAVHVTNGAKVSIKDASVSRKSTKSQGGDRSSFYGVGAAVLTTDGTSYISGSKITTNANGGAGIFSYNKGTTYVSDTTISTKKGTSGGLHVSGGGKLYAWNVTATTQGESSAAIRSDRGGGTMVIDGGTYTSNGTGSPAVYSTADIAIHQADLTSNHSESVCIEGLNSLRLFDCNLTGNMKKDAQNDCTWNVILYQSMSGDSEVGNSTFEMNGGTLTAKNGGMFYTTNTESTISLSNVDITYAKNNDFFLKCTGNSNKRGWGTSGSNGADCNFTADNQKMEGDVIWDSISQLDFYMSNGSTLKGAVTDDESNAGNGGDGYCNFYIEEGCTWTITGNSTLTKLYNAGSIVDSSGKTVTIKGTDGTVYVKGSSKYTITVSSYSTNVDLSGMTEASAWTDYETEKPSSL